MSDPAHNMRDDVRNPARQFGVNDPGLFGNGFVPGGEATGSPNGHSRIIHSLRD